MTPRKSIIALASLLIAVVLACSENTPQSDTATPLAEATQKSDTPTALPTPAPSTPTATATPIPPTQTPVATTTVTPTQTPFPTMPPILMLPTAMPRPTVEPTSTPERADSLDSLLETIFERTIALRELPLLKDLEPQMVSREDLNQTLQESFEEEAESIEEDNRLYTILGIIESGDDLGEILIDLLGESVLGFFDSETETLSIVRDQEEFTLTDEITVAHELVHGLQQQHFDIHSIRENLEDNSDQSLALRALIEGDATLGQVAYMLTHLDRTQQQEVLSSIDTPSDGGFDSAPPFIQRAITFPYAEGFAFAFELYAESFEWEPINDAFARIPKSTEQIMHPEKYQSDEIPVEVTISDLSEGLGEGWNLAYTDIMGEFFLKSYLETHLGIEDALSAAAGWGGDRFALYGSNESDLLVLKSVWDSQDDAKEFFDAFEDVTEARTGLVADSDADPRTFRIELPNQVIRGDLNDDEVLLIFAPDEQSLEAVKTLLAE